MAYLFLVRFSCDFVLVRYGSARSAGDVSPIGTSRTPADDTISSTISPVSHRRFGRYSTKSSQLFARSVRFVFCQRRPVSHFRYACLSRSLLPSRAGWMVTSSWHADWSIHDFDRFRPSHTVITSIRFDLFLRATSTRISDHGSPKHILLASSVTSKKGEIGILDSTDKVERSIAFNEADRKL